MKITTKLLALPIVLLLACDKSGTEAQREADKAQAEANTKTTSAQYEADKKSTNAQAEADKKVAEAQGSFDKTREDYRHDVQNKLDDLDKTLGELDAKAKKETGSKKAKLDANLPSVHKQRDAFAKDFASMQYDTATTWDASKKRIDNEWDALKKSVDKID
jgi:hypothetical protein